LEQKIKECVPLLVPNLWGKVELNVTLLKFIGDLGIIHSELRNRR